MSEERGLVQVFFGDGKGKTSAALGVLLRASGHGKRVLFLAFFKGRFSGEIAAVQCIPGVEYYQFGTEEFVCGGRLSPEKVQEFQCGWHLAQEALLTGAYDLIILDEFLYAFSWGLLSWETFRAILFSRKPWVEVVLTGREAPEELLATADLISEIRNIRHPIEQGIRARRGFEY